MFKRKKYTLKLTYDDNSTYTHEGVTKLERHDGFIRFTKDDVVFEVNSGKLYALAYFTEKK